MKILIGLFLAIFPTLLPLLSAMPLSMEAVALKSRASCQDFTRWMFGSRFSSKVDLKVAGEESWYSVTYVKDLVRLQLRGFIPDDIGDGDRRIILLELALRCNVRRNREGCVGACLRA